MPIDTIHPDYLAASPSWLRSRTVLAGENAVKRCGESLLPRNEGATDEQYERFLGRAHFFNATGRTCDGFVGLQFRRAPRIRNLMRALEADFDLCGSSLLTYSRTVAYEVMAVGRCGTYIDWSARDQRAYATLYRAEAILNWRVEVLNGKSTLTLVVLRETQIEGETGDPYGHRIVDQIRAVRLEEGRVVARTYRRISDEWVKTGEFFPSRMRKPLTRIPFVFHSSGPEAIGVPKVPLEDLIFANLDHYRLLAGQRNALHYVSMPILALAGFDSTKYGADTAQKNVGLPSTVIANSTDAHAKYVEYSGSALDSYESAIDRTERFMAMLGSRLLEPRKNVGETAEAIELRQSGESSVLAAMALCVSESISDAMYLVQWWGRDFVPGEPLPRITLNTDFNTQTMTPQQIRELVSAMQAGAITLEELKECLRRGEVLPPNPTPIAGDPES